MNSFLIQKYYQSIKQKIIKQNIMNFFGANPRLIAYLIGLGISVGFASFGRFAIHELLTTTTTTTAVTAAPPTFQVDYVDKTPVSESFRFVQHADALGCFTCNGCAKDFAPGTEATAPGDAQNVAPGDLAKSPGEAQDFAPGELKKK